MPTERWISSLPFLAIIWDASSYSRWKQIQRPNTRSSIEWESSRHSVLNGFSPSNPSFEARGTSVEEDTKKARWDWGPKETMPSNSTWAKLRWSHKSEASCAGLQGSPPGPQPTCYFFKFSIFIVFLSVKMHGFWFLCHLMVCFASVSLFCPSLVW